VSVVPNLLSIPYSSRFYSYYLADIFGPEAESHEARVSLLSKLFETDMEAFLVAQDKAQKEGKWGLFFKGDGYPSFIEGSISRVKNACEQGLLQQEALESVIDFETYVSRMVEYGEDITWQEIKDTQAGDIDASDANYSKWLESKGYLQPTTNAETTVEDQTEDDGGDGDQNTDGDKDKDKDDQDQDENKDEDQEDDFASGSGDEDENWVQI
jgi:hypothetical protein